MVEIYYIQGEKEEIFPLTEFKLQKVKEGKVLPKKTKVKLAPFGETLGKHSLEGIFTLRDKEGFYDGNTEFTDNLAIQFANRLGELYGVRQVIIHANFGIGTQSYDFAYKFEMRKDDAKRDS
jgi:hypothetical protein